MESVNLQNHDIFIKKLFKSIVDKNNLIDIYNFLENNQKLSFIEEMLKNTSEYNDFLLKDFNIKDEENINIKINLFYKLIKDKKINEQLELLKEKTNLNKIAPYILNNFELYKKIYDFNILNMIETNIKQNNTTKIVSEEEYNKCVAKYKKEKEKILKRNKKQYHYDNDLVKDLFFDESENLYGYIENKKYNAEAEIESFLERAFKIYENNNNNDDFTLHKVVNKVVNKINDFELNNNSFTFNNYNLFYDNYEEFNLMPYHQYEINTSNDLLFSILNYIDNNSDTKNIKNNIQSIIDNIIDCFSEITLNQQNYIAVCSIFNHIIYKIDQAFYLKTNDNIKAKDLLFNIIQYSFDNNLPNPMYYIIKAYYEPKNFKETHQIFIQQIFELYNSKYKNAIKNIPIEYFDFDDSFIADILQKGEIKKLTTLIKDKPFISHDDIKKIIKNHKIEVSDQNKSAIENVFLLEIASKNKISNVIKKL